MTKSMKGKQKEGLRSFLDVMQKLQENANEDPGLLIENLVRWTSYEQFLQEQNDDASSRMANVAELVNLASKCGSIEDILQNAALNAVENTEEEECDRVSLMTMHAAKGLEFPVVMIVGINEGTIPHSLCQQRHETEEERRLFYVAMTRAEKWLFLSRPRTVLTAGKPKFPKPSRFLAEIDSRYLFKVAQEKEL